MTRLNSHYREVLSTARIEVYYCGSAAAEQVEQAWREALMGLPRYQVGQLPETLLGEPAEVREITERLEVTQGKLVMGFRTGIQLTDSHYPGAVGGQRYLRWQFQLQAFSKCPGETLPLLFGQLQSG